MFGETLSICLLLIRGRHENRIAQISQISQIFSRKNVAMVLFISILFSLSSHLHTLKPAVLVNVESYILYVIYNIFAILWYVLITQNVLWYMLLMLFFTFYITCSICKAVFVLTVKCILSSVVLSKFAFLLTLVYMVNTYGLIEICRVAFRVTFWIVSRLVGLIGWFLHKNVIYVIKPVVGVLLRKFDYIIWVFTYICNCVNYYFSIYIYFLDFISRISCNILCSILFNIVTLVTNICYSLHS